MNDLVLLGKISKAHGIKGEVKIYPYSGDAKNFALYTHLFLIEPGDNQEKLEISRARNQGKTVIILFAGITNRNQAEELVGKEVAVQRDQLPVTEEDHPYLFDLLGRRVALEDGRDLGVITDFLDSGAHDILVVKGENGELLIPLVDDFLCSIEEDVVVMELPPGLLEMNAS